MYARVPWAICSNREVSVCNKLEEMECHKFWIYRKPSRHFACYGKYNITRVILWQILWRIVKGESDGGILWLKQMSSKLFKKISKIAIYRPLGFREYTLTAIINVNTSKKKIRLIEHYEKARFITTINFVPSLNRSFFFVRIRHCHIFNFNNQSPRPVARYHIYRK